MRGSRGLMIGKGGRGKGARDVFCVRSGVRRCVMRLHYRRYGEGKKVRTIRPVGQHLAVAHPSELQ